MITKLFKINDFNVDAFKGYSLPENLEGSDFVIPSGAVFPNVLRIEKFKKVKFVKNIKILKEGDILFNTGGVGTLGRSGFFDLKDMSCTADPFVLVIRIQQENILPKYVFYMLQTEQSAAQIQKKTVGTTGIISIKPKDILSVEIPVPIDKQGNPDLDEQKRLVSILERVQEIKNDRISASTKTAEFISALFLEIFGDPIQNPKKWPKDKLMSFCSIETGGTPPRANNLLYGDAIEWIKSDNILESEIYPTSAKERLSELGAQDVKPVEAGSILMTCIAGSLSSIGNVCLTDRKVTFNQQINAIIVNDQTNIYFMYVLLKVLKLQLHKSSSQVLKHIINKSNLQRFEVIRPPLELQEQFAKKFKQIQRFKEAQKESANKIDQLFHSLTSSAFSGQL